MKNIIQKICFSLLCIILFACTSGNSSPDDGTPDDIKINSKLLSAVIASNNHIDNKPGKQGKVLVTVHYEELSKIVRQKPSAILNIAVKASDNGSVLQVNNNLKIDMTAKEDKTLELPVVTVCKNAVGCDNNAVVNLELSVNNIKQDNTEVHFLVSNRNYYFSPPQAGARAGDDNGIVEVGAHNVMPGDSFKIMLNSDADVKIIKVDNVQAANYCEISSDHPFCKINYGVLENIKPRFIEHAIQANIADSGETLSFGLAVCSGPSLFLKADTTVMTLDKSDITFTVTRICVDDTVKQTIDLSFDPDVKQYITVSPADIEIPAGQDSTIFHIQASKENLQFNIDSKFTVSTSSEVLKPAAVTIDNQVHAKNSLFILKDASGQQVDSIKIMNDGKAQNYTFDYYALSKATDLHVKLFDGSKDIAEAVLNVEEHTLELSVPKTVNPGNYTLIAEDDHGQVGVNSIDNFDLVVEVDAAPLPSLKFNLTPNSKNLLEKLQFFYYVKITKDNSPSKSKGKVKNIKDDASNLYIYPEKPGVEGCAGITVTKIDVDDNGTPSESKSCANVKVEEADKNDCGCGFNEKGDDLKNRCIFKVSVADTFVNGATCNLHVKTASQSDMGMATLYSDSSKALPVIKVVADSSSNLVRSSDKIEMWSITDNSNDLLNSNWRVDLSADSISKSSDNDPQSIFNPDIMTSLPSNSFGYNSDDKAYEIYNYPGRTSSKALLPDIHFVAGVQTDTEKANPWQISPKDVCAVSNTEDMFVDDYRLLPNLGCTRGGAGKNNNNYRGIAYIPAGITVDTAGIAISNNTLFLDSYFNKGTHLIEKQDSVTMRLNIRA
jgi:hypothetical protein